jgi:hypothetical protein
MYAVEIHDEIKIVGSFSLPPTMCGKISCAFNFNNNVF